MKKHLAKKLDLSRETLTSLRAVVGGTELIDTVYRPQPSELCSRGCPVEC